MKEKRLLHSLGLFLLTPFLMAASRDPYSPSTSNYRDIDVKVERKETPIGKEGNFFDFTLSNKGSGYLYRLSYKDREQNITFWNLLGASALFSSGEIVKPNQDYSWEINAYQDSFKEDCFYGYAYLDVDWALTFSNINRIVKEEGVNLYRIDSDISGMQTNRKYVFLFTMEYEGKEHCSEANRHKNGGLSFRVNDNSFDMTKATITSIEGFSYEEHTINYAGFALGGVMYILLTVILPLHIFIAIAIIVIVILVKRHNRKKEKEGGFA